MFLVKLISIIYLMSFFFDSHIAFGDETKATYTTKDYGKTFSTGLVKPSEQSKPKYVSMPNDFVLPKKFSWREQTPGGLNPPIFQNNCGSCWSFSINQTLADLYVIKNPFFARLVFAPQLNVSCDKSQYGCGGGYFSAIDFFKKFGAVDESQFPYSASNEKCKKNLTPLVKIKDWFLIGQENREPTIDELKRALILYGPLSIEIAASNAFMSYSSGVYNNCNSNRVNHMIELVSFNDDEKAWEIKNSWDGWGYDGGYGKIVYEDLRGNKCLSVGSTAAAIIIY
jgi:C1A family cysteine protease